MPELPEVETVCRMLEGLLKGDSFQKVTVRVPALRFPVAPDLSWRILNSTIHLIKRRAKYIFVFFENQEVLILHLGMSGSIKKFSPQVPLKPHDHVIFLTQSGFELRFHDPRRFGMVKLVEKTKLEEFFKKLGREPLNPPLTGEELHKLFQKRKTPIKNLLLNQTLIVGIGNIYASEILYRARISPFKPAGFLTVDECNLLAPTIETILREAILAGGSTLKDYRQVDGTLGRFQNTFKVYNKEGLKCEFECQNVIVKVIQGGRSTFYCKSCQGERDES